MKPNVDLTEERIFTTREKPTGLFKELLDMFEPKKPWDFEHNVQLVDCDSLMDESIIYARNSYKYWNRHNLYDTGKICENCGFDASKKPWEGITCNCYSMTSEKKIPWKF